MKEDKRKMYCIVRFEKRGYGAVICVKQLTFTDAQKAKIKFIKETGEHFLYYIDTNVSAKEAISQMKHESIIIDQLLDRAYSKLGVL